MIGKRIAILGAGRSGVAIALAAQKRGAIPTVYDVKKSPFLAKSENRLRDSGIPLVAGHGGSFSPTDADILVTSPGVDHRKPILQDAKELGIEVIGEIEFAFRISKAPIVAITGTNGKSTTTVMTWLCLQALGHEATLCGNIYGSGYEEIPLTEAADHATDDQVLVAEISSFQLEWVRDFHPRCAAITNIKPDHLNRYDSFEDYVSTKHRIYRRMAEGDIYVCHDDPIGHSRVPLPRFAIAHTRLDKEAFYLGSERIPFSSLPFHGAHNYANAAMAGLLSASFHAGGVDCMTCTDAKAVLEGLRGLNGLSHRMEQIGERNGVVLINNSMCTNPEAILVSSKSLGSKHQHLLIGGVAKDLDFGRLQPYLKDTGIDVYLYGEDGFKICTQLGGGYSVFRTMAEAFQAAARKANPGDVIMLAPGCASLDQYQDFRARGDEFKQIAKEWLKNEQTVTH